MVICLVSLNVIVITEETRIEIKYKDSIDVSYLKIFSLRVTEYITKTLISKMTNVVGTSFAYSPNVVFKMNSRCRKTLIE